MKNSEFTYRVYCLSLSFAIQYFLNICDCSLRLCIKNLSVFYMVNLPGGTFAFVVTQPRSVSVIPPSRMTL